MLELLFLLLPLAAVSGFYFGRKKNVQKIKQARLPIPKQYFRGLNYLINEQPDKAVDVFLEMLDLNDELIETHLTLGSLFRRRGEVDRAIRIHQGLIARTALNHSQRSLALLELSRDYIVAGVLDRAENLLLELVDLKEQLEPSLTHLVNIYQQGKEWEKAIAVSRRLQSLIKEDFTYKVAHFYCELAELNWQNGCVRESITQLKKALKENYQCVRASLLLGDIEADMGDYESAVKHYKRVALQKTSFLSESLPKLSKCYQTMGKDYEIFEYIQSCLNDTSLRVVILSDPKYFSEAHTKRETLLDMLSSYVEERPSIKGINQLLQLSVLKTTGPLKKELQFIQKMITKMIENKSTYRCEGCGFVSKSLQWLCPGCKSWDKIKPTCSIENA